MLPNADGCGTGLQLSAKDVVLGRPDMIRPAGSLLGSDLLNGRTDRSAEPSHPKEDDSEL